jgi:hypothetical protein
MDHKKRTVSFWESVQYEAEHIGSIRLWRASIDGEPVIGRGPTKPQALADLKSAHALAILKRDRRSPQRP